MKKLFQISSIIFIAFLFLSTKAKTVTYKIFIVQDAVRQEVLFNDSILVLQKNPFIFEVQLENLEGVYLNASFGTLYYNTPLGKPFYDWVNISPKTMAEPKFNEDKDLLIDGEGICYWFYNTKDEWHRFDQAVKKEGNRFICTKSIEKLYDVERQESIALSMMQKDIYLVFFSAKDNKEGRPEKELERKKIRLTFKNN